MFTDRGYNYTAEAMTDVEVYYIPTVIFEDMVKSSRTQLMYVVQQLSSILKLNENRVQNITIPNAQDRVIQTLNYLMQDLGEQSGEKIVISCPLTTIEISKISGTSRETVSSVLKQLKNDSIVTILDKKLQYMIQHILKKSLCENCILIFNSYCILIRFFIYL